MWLSCRHGPPAAGCDPSTCSAHTAPHTGQHSSASLSTSGLSAGRLPAISAIPPRHAKASCSCSSITLAHLNLISLPTSATDCYPALQNRQETTGQATAEAAGGLLGCRALACTVAAAVVRITEPTTSPGTTSKTLCALWHVIVQMPGARAATFQHHARCTSSTKATTSRSIRNLTPA